MVLSQKLLLLLVLLVTSSFDNHVSEAFSIVVEPSWPSSSRITSTTSTSSSNNVLSRFGSTTILHESLQTTTSNDATTDALFEDEAVRKGKRAQKLQEKKRDLIRLLGGGSGTTTTSNDQQVMVDPILASPKTKLPLKYQTIGPVIVGATRGIKLQFTSNNEETYEGRTDTYYNLLTSVEEQQTKERKEQQDTDTVNSEKENKRSPQQLLNNARVLIPPPIRSALVTYGVLKDDSYIPMRDLFTSPSVSFAYERGWRQGFAAAGFPGADREYELAMEHFEPVLLLGGGTVVVDMSCATGLFTRRFASSDKFHRVLGCDYSQSMLTEARRRIVDDNELQSKLKSSETRLELIQLDVASIPMQNSSVDCLHAGAAMHCWPDLEEGLSEIYRVLKPGGRFFATTFLSKYFSGVQAAEGGKTGPQMQAFQYFESPQELKDKMITAGFKPEDVTVEILGSACAVIRCVK